MHVSTCLSHLALHLFKVAIQVQKGVQADFVRRLAQLLPIGLFGDARSPRAQKAIGGLLHGGGDVARDMGGIVAKADIGGCLGDMGCLAHGAPPCAASTSMRWRGRT